MAQLHESSLYGATTQNDDQSISTASRNAPASLPTPDAAATLTHQNEPIKRTKERALAPDLLRGALMVIMALDHTSVVIHTFKHGTRGDNESDGGVVKEWTSPIAYFVRTLTHLCAPGFTLLLGLGVVYLGRSRTNLGWSSMRLLRFFAMRAVVLTLVTVGMGFLATAGQLWFLNMVLFALAVDYFLTGLVWIVINQTEPLLESAIERWLPSQPLLVDDDDEERPLLENAVGPQKKTLPQTIAWHVHNVVLAVLSIVTIWWNMWLSEDQGRCQIQTSIGQVEAQGEEENALLRIWFWPVMTTRVMSGFPPMAWLSFSILGLLYGRILISKPWSRSSRVMGSLSLTVAFTLLFVMTRLLRFGNLSEGCLQTPLHLAHPDANPYLLSVRSFFYIVKYPPDVSFWAMTLAGNFLLLAAFDAIPNMVAKRFTLLLDLGQSALYYYVVHLVVIVTVGGVLVALFGEKMDIGGPPVPGGSEKGIPSVPAYFAIWVLVVLITWPLCRRYGRFKSTKPADSMWRFF